MISLDGIEKQIAPLSTKNRKIDGFGVLILAMINTVGLNFFVIFVRFPHNVLKT
jgi:hypothetical protein